MNKITLLLLSLLSAACVPKEAEVEYVTVPVTRETILDELELLGRVEAAKQANVMAPDDLSVLELKVRNAEKVSPLSQES